MQNTCFAIDVINSGLDCCTANIPGRRRTYSTCNKLGEKSSSCMPISIKLVDDNSQTYNISETGSGMQLDNF